MIPGSEQERLEHNLIQRVNLADSLRRSAALYPDRLVLTDSRGEVTYRQLHEDVNRVASGLLAAGAATSATSMTTTPSSSSIARRT
jgi:non-ribosomal peptide synthetase component E (peptide arylation enzyme)